MAEREKHWEIKRISKSRDGIYVEGINHFNGSSIFWDVNPRYGWWKEYDTSKAVVADLTALAICNKWGVEYATGPTGTTKCPHCWRWVEPGDCLPEELCCDACATRAPANS